MKIVPTISSGVAGPLGILHLPRLWQKTLLGTKGLLPSDYSMCGPGYDLMVLGALGISAEDTLAFFREKLPTYPQFEAWILEKKGGTLDAAVVDQLNKDIIGYNHKDEVRTSILSAAGVPDTGKIKDAVNLNNIDDWTSFHVMVKEA